MLSNVEMQTIQSVNSWSIWILNAGPVNTGVLLFAKCGQF